MVCVWHKHFLRVPPTGPIVRDSSRKSVLFRDKLVVFRIVLIMLVLCVIPAGFTVFLVEGQLICSHEGPHSTRISVYSASLMSETSKEMPYSFFQWWCPNLSIL